MPLQTQHFGQIPYEPLRQELIQPDHSGLLSLIPSIMGGYESGVARKRAGEEHQRKSRLEDLNFALREKLGPLEVEEKQYGNMSAKAKGMNAQEAEAAKLALLRAQASHHQRAGRNEGMTTTQRDLASIFGQGTPEYKMAMQQAYGLPLSLDTSAAEMQGFPKEVIGQDLSRLPKNLETAQTKEMEGQLKTAEGMEKSLKTLNELEKLTKDHPDLWKSFALMLQDPENKAGISSYLKKNVVNEKQQTAINKFNKLSSKLIAEGSDAFGGGQRFTDARQGLIAAMKPDVANTAEANRFIIQGMKDELSHGPEYANALRYGIKNRRKIISNPDAFRNKVSEEVNAQGGNQEQSRMVTIRNPKTGETRQVSMEEAKQLGAR